MIEIIEQNIFNRARFFIQVLIFFFWPNQYFQLMTSPVLNREIPYKMQIQRKCYFSFIVWMSLTKLYKPSETDLRQLFNRQLFWICVLSWNGKMAPNSALSHEFWSFIHWVHLLSVLVLLSCVCTMESSACDAGFSGQIQAVFEISVAVLCLCYGIFSVWCWI